MNRIEEERENILVERLCARNGWEYGGNEDYDEAVKDVKWFLSQPEICQLFPQPLGDKELREKLIGFEYCYQWCGAVAFTCVKQATCPAFLYKDDTWGNKAKHSVAKVKADQILALLQPKIEEAKKQEGKRIIKWVEEHKGLGYCDESCFHITDRDWQALKGGENE